MKQLITLIFCSFYFISSSYSQSFEFQAYGKDTLISISKEPAKGFSNDYLLYIPAGIRLNALTYLLVEPNNSGFVSDSMAEHRERAIELIKKRSLGKFVSEDLKVPMLVPIFPRLRSKFLIYTHALDRDAMLAEEKELKRIDLQLLSMVDDARERLREFDIPVRKRILLTGFSASGSFVNRFSLLHPERIQAVAAGGLNGILMLPLDSLQGKVLNFPLGVNDLQQFTEKDFDRGTFKELPQFLFMGGDDDNDAVLYDDAYSASERQTVFTTLGEEMLPLRWNTCRKIYQEEGVNAEIRTFEGVGHRSTEEINRELIDFFRRNTLLHPETQQ